VATQSRSDYGEITFRDWRLREFSSMATSPSIRSIRTFFMAIGLTRTKLDIGEYAKVTPEPIRRGEYRYTRTLPVVFRRSNRTRSTLRPTSFSKRPMRETVGRSSATHLTRESYEIPANLGAFAASDPEKGKHRGVIYAVAPSFKEANTIWAGTDDGINSHHAR